MGGTTKPVPKPKPKPKWFLIILYKEVMYNGMQGKTKTETKMI